MLGLEVTRFVPLQSPGLLSRRGTSYSGRTSPFEVGPAPPIQTSPGLARPGGRKAHSVDQVVNDQHLSGPEAVMGENSVELQSARRLRLLLQRGPSPPASRGPAPARLAVPRTGHPHHRRRRPSSSHSGPPRPGLDQRHGHPALRRHPLAPLIRTPLRRASRRRPRRRPRRPGSRRGRPAPAPAHPRPLAHVPAPGLGSVGSAVPETQTHHIGVGERVSTVSDWRIIAWNIIGTCLGDCRRSQ